MRLHTWRRIYTFCTDNYSVFWNWTFNRHTASIWLLCCANIDVGNGTSGKNSLRQSRLLYGSLHPPSKHLLFTHTHANIQPTSESMVLQRVPRARVCALSFFLSLSHTCKHTHAHHANTHVHIMQTHTYTSDEILSTAYQNKGQTHLSTWFNLFPLSPAYTTSHTSFPICTNLLLAHIGVSRTQGCGGRLPNGEQSCCVELWTPSSAVSPINLSHTDQPFSASLNFVLVPMQTCNDANERITDEIT